MKTPITKEEIKNWKKQELINEYNDGVNDYNKEHMIEDIE